ncbi:MAG: LacI family DNA-binding transcriptional regulator [Opitutaceae bacterium]|jgi:LacI family transcriptional regulator
MPLRVTLRDIAKRADVHISTVSLALRHSPKLRPEMRARILKIAEGMGYTPDPMLSALVAYRKKIQPASYQPTLAWIDNWPERGSLRGVKAFNEYFLGAKERAGQLGYKLEEFWLHAPGITPARTAAILRTRNIQGLIVPPQEYDGVKLDFDFTPFSAVALGYSLRPALLHIVTNHQAQSISLLFEKLVALGYRRIGLYLSLDWDKKVNHGYLGGFTTAQQVLPAKNRLRAHITGTLGKLDFLKWFNESRPDAVITQGLASGISDWIKPLRVPEDLGVADLSANRDSPHIAGIYQNDWLIGATAAEVVIGMLQRNERGLPANLIYTLVGGVWRPGPSLRSAPAPLAK